MTAKDIKPTNPDTEAGEAGEAKGEDGDEARKTDRKTSGFRRP